MLFGYIHRIMPWTWTITAIIRNKINQFSSIGLNLLVYFCPGSTFYCRFGHLKMSPSLTMCTQLRTLRTGSYAPGFCEQIRCVRLILRKQQHCPWLARKQCPGRKHICSCFVLSGHLQLILCLFNNCTLVVEVPMRF